MMMMMTTMMCVCVCPRTRVHMHAHTAEARMLAVSSYHSLSYFFETGFLTKPRAVMAAIKLAHRYWGLEFRSKDLAQKMIALTGQSS
jgi:hypothetical protein